MKHLSQYARRATIVLLFSAGLFVPRSFSHEHADPDILNGSWHSADGSIEQSLIVADGYCMLTKYDKTNKRFIHSFGGPLTAEGNKISLKVEFNSSDKAQVGKKMEYDFSTGNNILTSNIGGTKTEWQRTDDGKGELAGNWRITQRKQGDKMADIPLRARRTLKLLTGTRFQWAAINIETGEFSGTGGGAYTFANGKYTEHIEFFSRDNTRVGASLSFDGKVEDGNWIHSGLSSRGDPIYEIWSRII
ncbi:hypothetical protein [Agriterribacter sp.]|uniref:hypothetical protein n=1 Tax=Agriterribacter sp. TaxID=2821509 RepID=UPI002C5539CA|nr:hypothetical protein [Agriterribacter sp.]HRP58372.1 hypothetical protein [Agriterribacter sp.]